MNAVACAKETDPGVRLFVLECGWIHGVTAEEFGFEAGEIPSEMFTPVFLVVHPSGQVLLWDTGQIPDEALTGATTTRRSYTVTKPLLPQLKALGYDPANITYLALSHYHNDHTANANAFSGCHWLVQRAEREVMFAAEDDPIRNGRITPNKTLFSALESSTTTIIENRDHDVFGDGSVVLKFTPGHTPGHQSLLVRLRKTGPVLISGDLYHYPAEVNRRAAFVNHASNDQVTDTRREIEAFLDREGVALWIQHDINRAATFRKAPDYYE